MEFIKAEEFLKQPIEVQSVFINWWKPSIADIFTYRNNNNDGYFAIIFDDGEVENYRYNKGNDEFKTFKKEAIPLFTEGQLREFIENITGLKVRLEPYTNSIGIKGTQINLTRSICLSIPKSKPYYEEQVYKCFDGLRVDALKAYWQVAVNIAEQYLKDYKIEFLKPSGMSTGITENSVMNSQIIGIKK